MKTKEEKMIFSPVERKNIELMFQEILFEMKQHGLPDIPIIKRAYEFALNMHGATKRKNGEPYIFHPLAVAKILASIGHESDVVAAALLHDVMEDCEVPRQTLEDGFGSTIADTVDGVTKVSKKFAGDDEISGMDLDFLSDRKFFTYITEKHNKKVIYVKCADRIHNLRTIGVFSEEKQRAKAEHTRHVIIPAAQQFHMNKMVDILGTLCLNIENPKLSSGIIREYDKILRMNADTLQGSRGLIETTKKIIYNDSKLGNMIYDIQFVKRSPDSVFKDIENAMDSVECVKDCVNKKNVSLYDIFFISKVEYADTPESLFLGCYDLLHNSRYRLTITGIGTACDSGVDFYKLTDRYGAFYRLFLQSEMEHLEYMHGTLISEDLMDYRQGLECINVIEPGEIPHKLIKVYKMDGTQMMIDEGSTILDFAFAINPSIGICAKYGVLNGGDVQYPLYRKLVPGDMVEIVSDHDKRNPAADIPHATIRWFEYVRTRGAIRALSRWLEKHTESAAPNMIVKDDNGKEYEIEMASTVLDFAFIVDIEIGLHLKHAYVNKSTEPTALNRVLKYGDIVKLEYDIRDENAPLFNWLHIAKTSYAQEILIQYFEKKYNQSFLKHSTT